MIHGLSLSISTISSAGILSIAEATKLAAEQREKRLQQEQEIAAQQAKIAQLTQAAVPAVTNATTARKSNTAANDNADETTDKAGRDATNGRSLGFTQQQTEQETRQLARLAPARAQLSPSDELAVFADTSGGQTTSLLSSDIKSVDSTSTVQAVAEDGSTVQVDSIPPQSGEQLLPSSAQILSLNPNALASAASIYAKNQGTAYDITTLNGVAA